MDQVVGKVTDVVLKGIQQHKSFPDGILVSYGEEGQSGARVDCILSGSWKMADGELVDVAFTLQFTNELENGPLDMQEVHNSSMIVLVCCWVKRLQAPSCSLVVAEYVGEKVWEKMMEFF